jgi:galactokinase
VRDHGSIDRRAWHALLIDCRSLECRPVTLPADIAVIIAHSGVRHAHAGGAYNDRRRQCEAAAAHYGVAALRDVDIAMLESRKAGLNDIAFRRARHVVTENGRTEAAAIALGHGDLATMGALMAASHASMRDDFEITVPAVDSLTAIMQSAIGGEGGARMTGGGFGGCVVGLVGRDRIDMVIAAIARDYRDPNANNADVFVCRATDGVALVSRETRQTRLRKSVSAL